MSARGLVVTGTPRPGDDAAVLALAGSVPEWFRLSDETGGAHVAWVLAGDDAWPAAVTAALAAGADAVVVDSPRVVTPEDVTALAGAARPVVLAARRSHAPQVRMLARLVAPVRPDVAWVECLVVDGGDGPLDPQAAAWDALATLTAAGLEVDRVVDVVVRPTALLIDALAGSARVHVTCVRSLAATPRLRIAAFGAFGSLLATAEDSSVAFPGEVVRVDADGAHAQPTDHRTARLVAAGEVHAALGAGLDPISLLSAYSPTATLVSQVFRGGGRQAAPQPNGKEHN